MEVLGIGVPPAADGRLQARAVHGGVDGDTPRAVRLSARSWRLGGRVGGHTTSRPHARGATEAVLVLTRDAVLAPARAGSH